MASSPRTISSSGSGSSTSGLRRSLSVFSTAGRAPASSSIGSTSKRWPSSSRSTVAFRITLSVLGMSELHPLPDRRGDVVGVSSEQRREVEGDALYDRRQREDRQRL